ncbi:pancreatic triacylglycerol lipase [Halyomorpha halys]|uniref:pancreatic triacylglycerol lipase n=1 Tax=Halyomorpha halys TaxID=286706 RepID=UPI0034D38572
METDRRTQVIEELKPGNFQSVIYSSFDSSKKTKVIIHGWLTAGNNFFSWQMKNAYLDTHDFNVISVDWSAYSQNLYTVARWSIHAIGPYVSKMLDFLVVEFGVSPADIHIIGHSLGAHIAGLAGEHMSGNISRITGLDPAGPLFIENGLHRLDTSDADFVDVIHTSIRYVGYYPPIGHADFYPNGGGPLQPGCGFDIGFCTHLRSYKYYIESMYDKKGFVAQKCLSWNHYLEQKCFDDFAFMGENVSEKARGNFYLRTSPAPPFGLGLISNKDSPCHNTPYQ